MKFTTEVRVRYAETDQMGVVYHGNYFVWFEVGRVELLRSLGFTYRQLEAEDGCTLPVVEAMCRYRKPARYDDLLTIRTSLLALRGAGIHFAYQLLRAEELLAEGETRHVVLNRKMRPGRLPQHHRQALLGILSPA